MYISINEPHWHQPVELEVTSAETATTYTERETVHGVYVDKVTTLHIVYPDGAPDQYRLFDTATLAVFTGDPTT